ncbi:hypothetical protein SCHPADRAFT_883163 [Schizopora paradoxa]|uniref:Choline/ethanolaminephosphotransferase n=1 Tax=Schizopora paradoxa TaxID=27342 RepID=A0A0H2RML1_9AGAM|nr:hypothetical protein SCHPADRAFT_883163 [Schizopora paradoxa]
MGRYLTADALRNLDAYVYMGVDKSILSKYILNPYWTQLVKLWPKWVAPNTITLTGLSLVFFNFLTMLYYDPLYEGALIPSWVYFSWAACLFAYQSLDAIDGKQARRTNMAGPLGELFDHGCDAVNTSLEVLLTAHALHILPSCQPTLSSHPTSSSDLSSLSAFLTSIRPYWLPLSLIFSQTAFYLTTWESYHTHQLYLGVFSGPVEGILLVVGVYVVSGVYGAEFWDTNLFQLVPLSGSELEKHLPAIRLNEAFMLFGALGLGVNIFTSYRNVYKASKSSKSSVLLPAARLLPFVVSTALHVSWLLASVHLMPPHLLNAGAFVLLGSPLAIPILLAWGAAFAHQVGRVVLAHLTRSSGWDVWVDGWRWVILALGALFFRFDKVRSLEASSPYMPYVILTSHLFISTYCLVSMITYWNFVVDVIGDITEYLGIACLSVRKRGADGVWRSAVPGDGDMVSKDGKKLLGKKGDVKVE